MTTKTQIAKWFDVGCENGYSHMVVKRDWFTGNEYPVYVNNKDEAFLKAWSGDNSVELYVLDFDRKLEQLDQERAWNYE